MHKSSQVSRKLRGKMILSQGLHDLPFLAPSHGPEGKSQSLRPGGLNIRMKVTPRKKDPQSRSGLNGLGVGVRRGHIGKTVCSLPGGKAEGSDNLIHHRPPADRLPRKGEEKG